MSPTVSIILPTLNPGKFIYLRIRSILEQTFTDWELLIGDSGSDDGSREYLESLTTDPRISMEQLPRGLYSSWNHLLRKAAGRYIYVATADDWMENDALEKMVKALDEHPECGICDTRLKLIDSSGDEILEGAELYVAHHWHCDFPRDVKHIRQAPHDYFLHLCGKTVYTSIAQLLIRRSVFESCGYFPEDMGSSGDFLWGMRAALHCDILFLPEKLTAWRVHENQETFARSLEKVIHNFGMMKKMGRRSVADLTDSEKIKKAEKIIKLMYFKALLLPARYQETWGNFMITAAKAFFRFPLISLEFLWSAFCSLPHLRNQWFIRSYDRMALKRVQKLNIGKLIIRM